MSMAQVRDARPDDAPVILELIKGLARYERAEEQVEATAEHLRESLFSAETTTHGIICEIDGSPVGFAIYFYNYSTWQGRRGLYLEDLFVRPDARGRGAGKALLERLARVAVDAGCGRFEWSVLDWNTPAIEFYEALGAEAQSEWVRYRLEGDKLLDLAK